MYLLGVVKNSEKGEFVRVYVAQQAFVAFYNCTKVCDRSYVVFSKYDLNDEAHGNHGLL